MELIKLMELWALWDIFMYAYMSWLSYRGLAPIEGWLLSSDALEGQCRSTSIPQYEISLAYNPITILI